MSRLFFRHLSRPSRWAVTLGGQQPLQGHLARVAPSLAESVQSRVV